MSKKETINEVTEAIPENGTYLADLVKMDDGYHVFDLDGNDLGLCKLVDEGKTLALPKNPSRRQWFNLAKAEEGTANGEKVQLLYKASKTFGPRGTTVPDAKLIAYLPEEDQNEYKAIIERARAAMKADKTKPLSELEKLQAKLAKLQAKIEEYNA